MEIALLPKSVLRIKGKVTTMMVNPKDNSTPHQAALYFKPTTVSYDENDGIPITGPGEYEIGGIKISGIKSKEGNVFSVTIDGVDILIGDIQIVEKLQHKLKEHAIVLIQADHETDASFINGMATNVVLLYGDKAKEIIQKFDKEGVSELNKYQITKDKLPPEIQTVLLT